MSNLAELKNLRRLYLYSNVIAKIECLEHFKDLETLWINDNRISQLDVRIHD
jgi:Leucine-rich repeat (LRR) protein